MKTVGIALILSACLLADRLYKSMLMQRPNVLSELRGLALAIDNGLAICARPISELVSDVRLARLHELGFVDMLRTGAVPLDAYVAVREKLNLDKETDAVIYDFFKYIGKGTGLDVRTRCKELERVLATKEKSERERALVGARIFRVAVLSIAFGLAITVV